MTRESTLTIAAHRGACLLAVENTLRAFELALEAGADLIETDVRATRDGHLVLFHDPTLQRLSGRSEHVSALAWDELRDIPLGSTTSDQRVCRLADLLLLAEGRVKVLLDLKSPLDYAAALERVIRDTNAHERVILGVRSVDELRTVRQVLPGVPALGFGSTLEMEWAMAEEGLEHIRLRSLWTGEASVARAKTYGRVWVIGGGSGTDVPTGTSTLEELLSYRRLGVDGVLVNDPALAVQALRTR
jgi:glycerophosphoryl diester phosphodiesterase